MLGSTTHTRAERTLAAQEYGTSSTCPWRWCRGPRAACTGRSWSCCWWSCWQTVAVAKTATQQAQESSWERCLNQSHRWSQHQTDQSRSQMSLSQMNRSQMSQSQMSQSLTSPSRSCQNRSCLSRMKKLQVQDLTKAARRGRGVQGRACFRGGDADNSKFESVWKKTNRQGHFLW